jgi:hypothetical protein
MESLSGALAQARELVATLEALQAAQQAPEAVPAPTPAPAAVPAAPGPLAWGAKVSPVFRDRVRWIAEDLDIGPAPGKPEPNWPMAWMAFETARTFSPTIKNPGSSGTGLIQFMDETAVRDLHTTLAALRALSAEDQLNWVWTYLRNRIRERGPIRQLSDGYMAILLPSAMDDPESAVIWRKGDRAYIPNRGLDANSNGEITKAEAAAKIYAILAEGLRPENVA